MQKALMIIGVVVLVLAIGHLVTKNKDEQMGATGEVGDVLVSESVTETMTEEVSVPDDMMDESSLQAQQVVQEAMEEDGEDGAEEAMKEAVKKEVTQQAAPVEPVADEEVESVAAAAGKYSTYSAAQIAESSAEHVILFFHATWCPSCRSLDKDIAANSDNIPAGVEIYKVDYDTATDLKKKYGVTTQHSVIEINADGTAKSKISHPRNFEGVIATI